MAFTVGSTAAKDGAASPAAIPGGLLSADVAGGGVGPTFFFHGIVDGVAGVNKAQITAGNALKVDILAAAASVAKAEDVASADADVGIGALAIRKATPANTSSTDGDYEFLQMSAGRLWTNTLLGDGTNAVAVKAASTAPVATDPALVVSLSPNSAGVIGTGTQAAPSAAYISAVIAGDIVAAATDSGNPVKIGGVGKTANPTAVTDGQRVNAIYDKLGKQVVVGSVRDLKGKQLTTITSSTSETTVVTAVASTFLDVYGCIVENTSASACKVTFKDSTAGTTQFEFTVPAGDTRGFMLPESGAFTQTTVNNNWTATCGTSLASIVITMLYVKNI